MESELTNLDFKEKLSKNHIRDGNMNQVLHGKLVFYIIKYGSIVPKKGLSSVKNSD